MLNNNQLQIYNAAIEWWKNGKDQVFEISGPPGSGKSFLINEILRAIGISFDRVAPMAYTGTAAINMRSKGMSNAKTIHSWCYRTMVTPMIDEVGRPVLDPIYNKPKNRIAFIPKDKLDEIDLIIVDEAGTVPPEMSNILRSFGIPIIAAGDLDQLPPIFGKPGFLNDRNNVHFLTEIVRQASDNTIIQFSQMAIKGIDIPIGNYNNVTVIYEDQLTDEMMMNSDIIICSKNATRDKYNEHIRKIILKYSNSLPNYGERIVCRKNNWEIEAGGINLTNGLLGSVVNHPDASTMNLKDNTFKLSFKPDLNDKVFEDIDADYRYLNAKTQEEKNIIKASPHFPGNKFEYGYCITTHMSQGSEFNNGIYIEEFLNNSINKNLHYVGITRFRNHCLYVKKRRKRYYYY